ncbi:hypothetical protein ABZX65_27055 [Streptomyces sp. NPDC003300]|uniref:hypothetical protein n=1 Tax=unclassified Streptomyces TaxID=2593676 RepID=UPI0033AAB951
MRIRRTKLKGDFVQLPNSTVRDERLSHMARGILAELLSRPDGWEATADDTWRASVAIHGKDSPGRRQFRAAFAELKEYGYLIGTREPIGGGRHATVLTLTDMPHAGTSVRPAEFPNDARGTDIPHAGTSDSPTDVPPGGTSVRPAQTDVLAGRTDVPLTDVPHAGTSIEEDGLKNTGLKTSSSRRQPARQITDEDKVEFGNFWALFPKSQDPKKTRDAWTAEVLDGADPRQITAAAVAYAHDQAGNDWQFVKSSAGWLRDKRYLDKHAPVPDGKPNLKAVRGFGYRPYEPPPPHVYHQQKGF